MWNAINCVENSGLCSSILQKFETYVCGTVRWQARTGDKGVNDQYEQYIRFKTGKAIDITGRFTLRQMAMLDIKGAVLKGDVGTNIVREGPEIYLQGIEADRIGNPYSYDVSNNYVRGLHLGSNGQIVAVRVYYQDRRSGRYRYDDTFQTRDEMGLPKFLFMANPISYDDYRGVSVFKSAIDNSTYIDAMRSYELQAMLWAASQSGVYYTKSGLLPEQLPFDKGSPTVDASGNVIATYQVRPNTITAMSSDGEKVEMFPHDRPSPNVIGMFDNTIKDISVGTGLTSFFTWGQTGLTGPAVRMASAQDARAIQIWQELLRESKLDPVFMLLLGNGIANGEIPYHPKWMNWEIFFPAKPTIDVGRESQAGINEINANVNTGAAFAAESGQDIDEIKQQRAHETEQDIDSAMEIAKAKNLDWREVYALMIPGQRKSGNPLVDATKAAQVIDKANNPDKPGATSDGSSLDDVEDAPLDTNYRSNGHAKREEIVIRHEFGNEPRDGHNNGNGRIEYSAYHGDCAIADLPNDTKEAIKTAIGGEVDESNKVAKYGMTASELMRKADPHNLEAAQKNIKRSTISAASSEVYAAPDKHILLVNDRIMDGHHHLAKAIKGKVTKSLPVLDLTPLRFQSSQTVKA